MSTCPFCQLEDGRQPIAENELAFALYDKHPVSDGHTLLLPRRHVPDYFNLTPAEQRAIWAMANDIRQLLIDQFQPDGFNVGINCGEVAGQTVFHAHVHLIPRYAGDVESPRGGVRGVKPEKMDYGS